MTPEELAEIKEHYEFYFGNGGYPIRALVAEIERLQAQNEGLREYSKGCLLKFADANSEAALLCTAARNLITYRDSAGPLNFQLEKADDFINELRGIVSKLA